MLGHDPAGGGADGKTHIHGGHIDADGPAPPVGREYGRQDGHARGDDHGGPHALKDPEGDQHENGRGQGGQRR